jgi:hypothetical protein
MKYLSECDFLIYDLHAGNPRDVDLALAGNNLSFNYVLALKKYNIEEEKVLILISSLMVWNKTPKKLKEIRDGKIVEDEPANGEGEEGKEQEEGAQEEKEKVSENLSR